MNIDYSGLTASELRERPRLPSPGWALVFVALAGVDVWQAMTWLLAAGPRRLTPEMALYVEADVAWGVLLGATLLGSYWRLAPRGFAAGVVASLKRERPRRSGGQWWGVLFIALLYGLTFLPLLLRGPEGLAARSLAAVPVDLAMAACLWDLRRYHREAWRILRHLRGEVAQPADAALASPEVRALTADMVLAAPRQRYNLPLILAAVQIALFAVGLTSISAGAGTGLTRLSVSGMVWGFCGWGVAVGLWGVWHESRKLRGRELEMALCAVLREPRQFPLVWWDWWGYTVILVLFGGALYVVSGLTEAGMRVAGGALALGYGLGVFPLYRGYARPWALAWEILRAVRGRDQGARRSE